MAGPSAGGNEAASISQEKEKKVEEDLVPMEEEDYDAFLYSTLLVWSKNRGWLQRMMKEEGKWKLVLSGWKRSWLLRKQKVEALLCISISIINRKK